MTERYLEDFETGQTFRSGRIRIDADRIKRFATEFDPNRFISTNEPPANRCLEVSPQAAGTPRRSR